MRDEKKSKDELISELQLIRQSLDHAHHHDLLTQLPNRILFQQHFKQALDEAKQQKKMLALLFLDIDRLQSINNFFGHHVGDQLLIEFSDRITSVVKHTHQVARFAGDEYIIYLSNIEDTSEVIAWSNQLLDQITKPWSVDGYVLNITVSMGVSLFPRDGSDMETLLHHANIALYESKEIGAFPIQFYKADMQLEKYQRLSIESQLQQGLDNEEFFLHYQPQFNLKTGNIEGMEALLRWQHPELGMIAPKEFIPIAEETGLILPLGQWVLTEACRQNKIFQDKGYAHIKVAVNLSMVQFHQSNIVDMIIATIEDIGLEPCYLELEITESVFIKDYETTIEKINKLKKYGFKIVIDDFGTGYSSLSYLKSMMVDSLKIDQSFVRNITNTISDGMIPTSIISLANKLNIDIVAEGVETKDQLDFLTANNCHKIQGFLLGRPVSATQFENVLLHGAAKYEAL